MVSEIASAAFAQWQMGLVGKLKCNGHDARVDKERVGNELVQSHREVHYR